MAGMVDVVKNYRVRLQDLAERKNDHRASDLADLRSGVAGEKIAERNAWVSPQSARKARIVFA